MKLPGPLTRALFVILLLPLAFGACGPEQDQPETEAAPEPMAREQLTGDEPSPADTTAEAMWSFLEAADYRSWGFWPGKEPFYQGTEPHGALLNTYLNDLAMSGLDAIHEPDFETLPFGSVLVKENHLPDSTLAAVTVMAKLQYFDPDHNDWFWMKRLPDGTVEASGRVESCIACHSQAAEDWDYLMTAMNESASGQMGGGS